MVNNTVMNSLGKSICHFWHSSIGKKIVVALTGLLMVGFLVGHMAGNLLLFAGRGPLNDYAEFLHDMLHGGGIWVARIGLLVSVVLHIAATVSLTQSNKKARGSSYVRSATVQASRSSRIMIISGLVILAFIFFHIFHFTVRWVDPSLAELRDPTNPTRHDVYGMVIKGFQVPWVAAFYVVAISLLCSHLSHGIASIFQTIGMRSRKTRSAVIALSWGLTALLWIGFLVIPLSIILGLVSDEYRKKAETTVPSQTIVVQAPHHSN